MNAERDVIRKHSQQAPVHGDRLADTPVEPGLLPGSRRLLRELPVAGLERSYLRHLESRLRRNPRDLLSHVRRLLLYAALDDNGGIYASLIDLWLVLGERAAPLRRRMFFGVREQLSEGQRYFFEGHIDTGLDRTTPTADVRNSVLSAQLVGTTAIVRQSNDDLPGAEDPVLLARQSMENDQVGLAQVLLEGALQRDPGDEQVCLELLRLYRDRGLARDFMKTYATVLGRRLAVPQFWQAMAAEYRAADDGLADDLARVP